MQNNVNNLGMFVATPDERCQSNLLAIKLFSSCKQSYTPLLFIIRKKISIYANYIIRNTMKTIISFNIFLWLALIHVGYFSHASGIFGASLNVQNMTTLTYLKFACQAACLHRCFYAFLLCCLTFYRQVITLDKSTSLVNPQ